MVRLIDQIIIHGSATTSTVDARYHYIVRRDGEAEKSMPINKKGDHAKGYNDSSVGVYLDGDMDGYTKAQFRTLEKLLIALKAVYPFADICGHCDLPNVIEDCPRFDVKAFIKNITFYKI